jgi:hypothetical protein
MFCSRSVGIHLLRGVAAICGLLAAALADGMHPTLRPVAVAGAFVMLRGCPMCWLVGLLQTLARRGEARRSTSIRGHSS